MHNVIIIYKYNVKFTSYYSTLREPIIAVASSATGKHTQQAQQKLSLRTPGE
jgi:hypothetical protein